MLNMLYSKRGVALTEQFEGVRLVAYKDSKGVWTIGYGHTGPEVHEGLVWEQWQAEDVLIADYNWAEAFVNRSVQVQLTQNEFDALVDFAFNVGVHAFEASTLLRYVNSGDFKDAELEFLKWDRVNGQVIKGLLERRKSEALLFASKD